MPDPIKYQLTRALRPAWLQTGNHESDLSAVLGGQAEWFWGVPGVFQALAAPMLGLPVPEVPRPNKASDRLGYWTPLHYLLLHRMGWSLPDQGLRRWYEVGRSKEDPTLSFIDAVWGNDRMLDHYFAWLLRERPVFLHQEGHGISATWPNRETPHESPLAPRWEEWLRVYDSRQENPRAIDGGYDPLHLSLHSGESGERDADARVTVVSLPRRRAVYATSKMDFWYLDLTERGRTLPDLGDRSWHVDVFVKPVGFLGTFRKSRTTGRWFTGRHRFHMWGNPAT